MGKLSPSPNRVVLKTSEFICAGENYYKKVEGVKTLGGKASHWNTCFARRGMEC